MWGWDREVKLSRGRPQQTWDGVVKKDMGEERPDEGVGSGSRGVANGDPYPYPC